MRERERKRKSRAHLVVIEVISRTFALGFFQFFFFFAILFVQIVCSELGSICWSPRPSYVSMPSEKPFSPRYKLIFGFQIDIFMLMMLIDQIFETL